MVGVVFVAAAAVAVAGEPVQLWPVGGRKLAEPSTLLFYATHLDYALLSCRS